MKKVAAFLFLIFVIIFSCKKENGNNTKPNKPLYPLAIGNVWIYIDSFFDEAGVYKGLDTFKLKSAKTINYNNQIYTPITDQFDDSIFTISSTDSAVFILNPIGAALFFKLPINQAQPVTINSYKSDSLNSKIFTQLVTTTNFPSYKILITQDDGFWLDYKQQELYFTIGTGIIKGRDIRKTFTGNTYAYDSYRLLAWDIY